MPQCKKRLCYKRRAFWNGLMIRQKHYGRCSWTRKKPSLTISTGPSGRDAGGRSGGSRESTHCKSDSLPLLGKMLCWIIGFKAMMNIRRGTVKVGSWTSRERNQGVAPDFKIKIPPPPASSFRYRLQAHHHLEVRKCSYLWTADLKAEKGGISFWPTSKFGKVERDV